MLLTSLVSTRPRIATKDNEICECTKTVDITWYTEELKEKLHIKFSEPHATLGSDLT